MHTCSCDKQNRQNGITSKQKALYKDSLTQSTCWRSMSARSANSVLNKWKIDLQMNLWANWFFCCVFSCCCCPFYACFKWKIKFEFNRNGTQNPDKWTADRSMESGIIRNDGSIHWERHMQRQWKWLPNENGRTDTLCLIDCMLCVLSRIDKVGTMFVVRLCDNQTNIVCRRWRWLFNSNSILQNTLFAILAVCRQANNESVEYFERERELSKENSLNFDSCIGKLSIWVVKFEFFFFFDYYFGCEKKMY